MLQRCWSIPGGSNLSSNSYETNQPIYLEIMKAIQKLQKANEKKCKCKKSHLKGKSVPGKNLSKNSQCDGNDDEAPLAKRSRVAAKNARKTIAQQSQIIDAQLPKGDKAYEPDQDNESEVDDDDYDDDADDCDDVVDNGQEREASNRSDGNNSESGMSDDFQSAHSSNRVTNFQGAVDHCWVESFEIDINSKRLDQFSIMSEYQ